MRWAEFALVAALATATASAQPAGAPPAAFLEALKIFQQARNGDSGSIEPAIAAFDALARAEPRHPVYAAYLGSALGLRARGAWMPWNKMKYAEEGLDRVDQALAGLKPEHDRVLVRGVPASLETRFVAANLFIGLPDAIFHRRAAGRKLLAEVLRNPGFAAAPAEFRAAVQRTADAAGESAK